MPCQAHFTFTSLVWKRYQQSSKYLSEKRETSRTEHSTWVPWRKPRIRCAWWQSHPLTIETHSHPLTDSLLERLSLIITLKLRRYTRGSRRVTSAGFYTKKDLHTKICTNKSHVCCFNKSWEVSTMHVKATRAEKTETTAEALSS